MKPTAILIAALALVPAAAPAAPPTPTDIASSIHTEGAKATIASLVKTNQWNDITNLMAEGQPAWIALAPSLATGTDAGTSEDLGISLAFALPKSPRAVLTAIDPKNGPVLGVDRVCGVPFIEGTIDNIDAYIKSSKSALNSIKDPALATLKAACLKALD